MGKQHNMPNEQDSGGGHESGGHDGGRRRRGLNFSNGGKPKATKRLSSKGEKKEKMSQIARKEEEQMWNMLRNVSIVIGFIFFMFAVYAFSKKGSLSTPESYTGYDGNAI